MQKSFLLVCKCTIIALIMYRIFPDFVKTVKIKPLFKNGTKMIFKITGQFLFVSFLKNIRKAFLRTNGNISQEKQSVFQTHYTVLENQNLRNCHFFFSQKCCFIIDQNEVPIGIFLDLSKAFDVIDHKILLSKLPSNGIRGIALDWITSYLKHRTQRVEIPYWQERTLHTYISNSLPIVHGGPARFDLRSYSLSVICKRYALVY